MANETGLNHRGTASHLGFVECRVWESLLTVWLQPEVRGKLLVSLNITLRPIANKYGDGRLNEL